MKVLLVHNSYTQPGGEDTVVAREARMLRDTGHTVIEYSRSNKELEGLWKRPLLPIGVIWASDALRDLRKLVIRERPDVAHFHNTFAVISPAAYFAFGEHEIPVIQSLHNPRLICPSANFYRGGKVCTDCLGRTMPWPGIVHGCYRNSHVGTAVVGTMIAMHGWLGTWANRVDMYVVFTEFYRDLFVRHGLPSDKIVIKPHFVSPDPGMRCACDGDYALFIGRLDAEKGIRTVMRAWKQLGGVPLKIRGGGRLLQETLRVCRDSGLGKVEFVDWLPENEMLAVVKKARFLVWPSEGLYETFGLVAAEAFACGVPVIASGIGAMAEMVKDGRTGLHFRPGDAPSCSSAPMEV